MVWDGNDWKEDAGYDKCRCGSIHKTGHTLCSFCNKHVKWRNYGQHLADKHLGGRAIPHPTKPTKTMAELLMEDDTLVWIP